MQVTVHVLRVQAGESIDKTLQKFHSIVSHSEKIETLEEASPLIYIDGKPVILFT